jgi:hypothetical protein
LPGRKPKVAPKNKAPRKLNQKFESHKKIKNKKEDMDMSSTNIKRIGNPVGGFNPMGGINSKKFGGNLGATVNTKGGNKYIKSSK